MNKLRWLPLYSASFLLFLHFQFCPFFVTVLGFGHCKIQDSSSNSLSPQQEMKSTWWIREKLLLSSRKSWFYPICWLKAPLIAVLQAAREGGDSRVPGVCPGDQDWWPSVGHWQDPQEGAEAQPPPGRRPGTSKRCPPGQETWETGAVLDGGVTSSLVLCCEDWEPAVYLLWSRMCCICADGQHLIGSWGNLLRFLQVNSKGCKAYGAGSSLYGGTITINGRKVRSGAWLWARGRTKSRRTRA